MILFEKGKMGQIADDMANGSSCTWCGIYFIKAHGYSVACVLCFDGEERLHPEQFRKTSAGYIHEHSGVQRAIYKEL